MFLRLRGVSALAWQHRQLDSFNGIRVFRFGFYGWERDTIAFAITPNDFLESGEGNLVSVFTSGHRLTGYRAPLL